MPLPASCWEGCARRLPGVGGAGKAGLSPGQQRDSRAACKMMGLKPGEKIRILKENQSFFPSWWGKGRFTAFSCHNQARSLGSQTEYWIFFFIFFFSLQKTNPIFSHSAQMWLQGRGACASGRGQPSPPGVAAGEALPVLPSQGFLPGFLGAAEQMPKPGTNLGSAKAEEEKGW